MSLQTRKISSAQKQATLESILKHAYDAFTQEDYENVKLSAISKASHIAEGTLFNYFKDKPTLFIATFIHHRNGNDQIFIDTFLSLVSEQVAFILQPNY